KKSVGQRASLGLTHWRPIRARSPGNGYQSVGAKHSQSPAYNIPKGVVSKLAVSRARIADLDTQNGERNDQEITNDTHMLVGELGMLLGLLVPNRVTPLGDKLRAAGVNPDGRPARLLLPSVSPGDPALEDLSAFDVAAAWRGFDWIDIRNIRWQSITSHN
ncbi:17008_t:CDS:2, partial [Acaulospora colombiana]